MPVAASTATGLRGRLIRGTVFEIGGFGVQVLLRMGSNLILTRLLFPAAFGLSSIVYTLGSGLYMLSDVAIQPCVIQSKRGDDPAFLNTAFTVQALRGVALTLVMVALAKPVSWFYHEPQLVWLIVVGSLQILISGVHSTATYTLRRNLQLGWINGFDLVTSVISTTITVIWARATPSAMALVMASVAGTLLVTISSHFLPVGYRNRLQWQKESVDEIRHFGRWVFGSSIATYLGGQSDRILLGRFLGAAWLGVYGIAANLAELLSSLIIRIANGVLYPALSHATRDPERDLSRFFYRFRLRLDALSMGSAGLLAGMGSWLVSTLWDSRYANASWMVQILAVRVAVTLLLNPSETLLLALGQTRNLFLRSTVRLVSALICIPVGWYLKGPEGLVWGAAASEVPSLIAVWPRARQLGVLRLGRELIAVVFFGASFALGRLLLPWLPRIHIR